MSERARVAHSEGHVLDTERLTLRRMTEDDAPHVLELLNEPSFIANIGDRGVRTLDDARRYVRDGPQASYDRHGFGLWLVVLRADDAPIGICGLLKRDALDDVDVGFALLPRYWSRGYAHEAAAASIAYGQAAFGLTRVAAVVQPHNAASIRVLEKLGMTYERTTKLSDDGHDVMLYARDL